MKFTLATIALSAVVLCGCATASLNSSVYNSENLAVDAATSATHSFNLYYEAQVTPDAKLVSAKSSINTADIVLSQSLTVLDGLRTSYVTNSSATNETAIMAGLSAVQSQASNIVSIVNFYVK